jgi:hypothetical protein
MRRGGAKAHGVFRKEAPMTHSMEAEQVPHGRRRRISRRTLRILGSAIGALLVSSALVGTVTAGGSSLNRARDATEDFRSLNEATEAGYGLPPAGVPLHECIWSLDGTGAMGFHYINGSLLDDKISATHPEALVYAPNRNGNLRLVALEYVVFQDAWKATHGNTRPMLFGQMFMATGSPNRYAIPAFYSLHVWLYKTNPAGIFAPFNPNVSCGGATSASASSTTANAQQAIAIAAASRLYDCEVPVDPA